MTVKKSVTNLTMHQPELQTERLVLRGYNLADAKRVAELVGNYEVAKTTQTIAHPYTLDMAVEWINSHRQGLIQGSRISYALLIREQKTLIGTVGLINISENQAGLGYWIGQPYWGVGYCTEAVTAVLDYAFSELGIKRVYADHYANNPASGKVMHKSGMLYVGQRDDLDRNGDKIAIKRYEIINT